MPSFVQFLVLCVAGVRAAAAAAVASVLPPDPYGHCLELLTPGLGCRRVRGATSATGVACQSRLDRVFSVVRIVESLWLLCHDADRSHSTDHTQRSMFVEQGLILGSLAPSPWSHTHVGHDQ